MRLTSMPARQPALQLADVHARLEAEGDVARRVFDAHGVICVLEVAAAAAAAVLLLGHGLGEILVEALGAGREIGLRVDANHLSATSHALE